MKKICTLTIIIYDVNQTYSKVNDLLHSYASIISLRVGYPVPKKDIAIIFLVVETDNDTLGAISGKLGQIPAVKTKSNTLNV